MRKVHYIVLAVFVYSLTATGQTILDDFRCRTAIAATNANPVVLTCNEPHGMEGRFAQATFSLGSKPIVAGATVTIDGETYTYDSTLDDSLPRHLLLSTSKVENVRRLHYAINDTGDGKGTVYSSPTTAHPTFKSMGASFTKTGMQINTITDVVTWKGHGLQTGDLFTVSSSNSTLATTVPPFSFYKAFYAIRESVDTFRVASALENAQNGVYLDLTASQGGNYLGIQASCAGCAPEWAADSAAVSVTVVAKTAGLAGAGKALSATGSPGTWDRTTSQVTHFLRITGAKGNWAALGSDTTPKGYTATILSPTTFSVPLNSSSYGTFAGQDIRIQRANGDLQRLFYASTSESPWVETRVSANHALAVTVPMCEPAMNDEECSKGYWSPDNQKAYMNDEKIQSFVVSGSTITITLTAPFADNDQYPHLTVGQLIHVRGYQQYATATNPGYNGTPNAPAQVKAALFAKTSKNGFRVRTLSPDRKVLTINNPGLADGTYSGSCLPGGVCVGRSQAEPYIATTAHASPYLYGTPRIGGYLWPQGFMWWNAKNPQDFDPDSNRFRYWVKLGKNIPAPAGGAYGWNWGTYPHTVRQNTSQGGAHFYHYQNPSFYKDRWQLLEFNCAPGHEVSAAGGINWPNEPLKGHGYYPSTSGGPPRGCMEGQTINYQDSGATRNDMSGQVVYFAEFTFDKVVGEPDEAVRSRAASWSPARFSGFGGTLTGSEGYEVTWASAPTVGISFDVRYSTAGSLKTNGWSFGTAGGTVTPPGVALSYTGTMWQSPAMGEAADFWVGIRPRFPVRGTTGSDANPSWMILASDPALNPGDTVQVAGVGGNSAVNLGSATVVNVAPRRFFWRYQPQDFAGGATTGDLADITASGGTCTAHFTVAHGLPVGWVIEVVGSTSTVLGNLPLSTPKLYTISAVPDSNSAVFPCPAVPNGVYDQDNGPSVHLVIITYPGIAIGVTGSGTYTTGGTVISTGETRGFAEVHLPKYVPYGAIPSPPSNLAGVPNGSSVLLSWTDTSADEDDFVLERQTNGSGPFETTVRISENASSYVDQVPSGTTFAYRIHARNAVGSSAYSNTATVTMPQPLVPPAAPGNARLTNVLSDEGTLEWDDLSSNEEFFNIEADNGTGDRRIGQVGANTTSFKVSGLEPQTVYRFRVQSGNAQGASAWAVAADVTTQARLFWRLGLSTSTAALVYYHAPDGAPCTLAAGGLSLSDGGGPMVRDRVLTGLTPEASNPFSIVCSTASASGTVKTGALHGDLVTTLVAATAPDMAGVETLAVQLGATPETLVAIAATPCTAGRCSVAVTTSADTIQWLRYRWCRNALSDPLCENAENELAASGILPFIP